MDTVTHPKTQRIIVSKDDPLPEMRASQKKASVNDAKSLLQSTTLPVVLTTAVVSEDESTSQLTIKDRREAAPLNSGTLTPSGPPESQRRFSLQDFKRSFYDHWMKDKSIEESNPFGFHSATASPKHSGSQSPNPASYAESLVRRGSLGGSQE